MKNFLLLSILSLSTMVFSCPGGTEIKIDSEITTITGYKTLTGKTDGYLIVKNKRSRVSYRVELEGMNPGDTFLFPATKEKIIYFKAIDDNEDENIIDIIYEVGVKGEEEVDYIYPSLIPKSPTACGYERTIF